MNLHFQSAVPAMQVTQVLCVQKHCLSDSVLPELETLGHCFPSSVVRLPRSLLKEAWIPLHGSCIRSKEGQSPEQLLYR